MKNPVSTYRIQFHKDFTFRDFERIIPYLDQLGIRTLYASPIFESVPGSLHGYDSVNPQCINPEIGTQEELYAISRQLTQRGMSWIQDIVPNHMAFDPHNPWLMDVLEKGQLSPYASYFDIDWQSPVYGGRLMVPFLGDTLEAVLDRNELMISQDNGRFGVTYFDTTYPLNLNSYTVILQAGPEENRPHMENLINRLTQLEQLRDKDAYAQQTNECQQLLAGLMAKNETAAYIHNCLTAINSTPSLVKQIVDQQAYQLCFHGETDQQINYRRFFTVNALICLNIQDPAVFEAVHQLPKALLQAGVVHGLRVDHIDGLQNPERYLHQLRQLAGPQAYIVVEKILQNDEPLPADWPVQGATGYAYLSMVNNLFTRTESEAAFTRFYTRLLGEKMAVRQELYDKKAYILYQHMNGELENLYRLFLDANLVDRELLSRIPAEDLKRAIGSFLIQCPVYRYYGNQMPLSQAEATAIETILHRVRTRHPDLAAAVELLETALLQTPLSASDDYKQRALRFYQRCMQFTGPLMAKGVEDTLMYTYTRFIGHDEVGDSPEYFGLTVAAFHQKMLDRQAQWPLTLNATSTHDTKRGEDVRSRLNVLTDLTDEWIARVEQWQQLNKALKATGAGQEEFPAGEAPDANDEYFIYQTLIGAYPMPGGDAVERTAEETDFPDRLTEYLQKAMREAKRNSTYDTPNEAYEEATQNFARRLLDKGRPFWADFQQFYQEVADFGIINSLAQVLLKCTSPGVPDIYQGCEGWDLSLVDPDNRRPVDFNSRERGLNGLLANTSDTLWADLWANRFDARIKQWLVHTLLAERNRHPDLFAWGDYMPLSVEGRYKEHVLAFARRHEQIWYVVAVPLGLARLCRKASTDIFGLDWADTHVSLPAEAPTTWQHRLVNSRGEVSDGIPVADLFAALPLAILTLNPVESDQSAQTSAVEVSHS